jgi:hypothetical protein
MQIMIVRTYSAYSKGPIKDMYFPRQNAPTQWVCVEGLGDHNKWHGTNLAFRTSRLEVVIYIQILPRENN